jgi:hypothetical protein
MKTFLTETLENSVGLYLSYLKFRNLVELNQLMPDKECMAEIKDLKAANLSYQLTVQELMDQID